MDTSNKDSEKILYVSKLNIDRNTDNFLEAASVSKYPMLVRNIYDEAGNICRIIDVETINGKTKIIPDVLAGIFLHALECGYRYVAVSDMFDKDPALPDYSDEWNVKRFDGIDMVAEHALSDAGFHPVRENEDGKPFYEYDIPAGIFTPTEEDVKEFRNTVGLSEEEAFGAWIGDKAEALVDAKNREAFEHLRAVIPDGFADDEKIRKFVHERITYSYKNITNHCIEVMVMNGWAEPEEFKKL